MSNEQVHHLSFGLIADVQYADVDDGTNYAKTRRRYYRSALRSLTRTISMWKNLHNNLAFVVQLGDLIDGINMRENGKEASDAALKAALAPFKQLTCPTYHMIGNHDLYNLTRMECLDSELHSGKLPNAEGVQGQLYFSVEVHPRLRLVVLDTYDVGLLGFNDCPDHPHYLRAKDILEQNNPHSDKNSSVNLKGVAARFVAYNGAIGKEQLMWLDAQLTEADSKRQNVLICGEFFIVTHIVTHIISYFLIYSLYNNVRLTQNNRTQNQNFY